MLLLYSGIHALLFMRHHPGLGPGLDLDRDRGQGQEAGLYRDQDQEVVAGSAFDLPFENLLQYDDVYLFIYLFILQCLF